MFGAEAFIICLGFRVAAVQAEGLGQQCAVQMASLPSQVAAKIAASLWRLDAGKKPFNKFLDPVVTEGPLGEVLPQS